MRYYLAPLLLTIPGLAAASEYQIDTAHSAAQFSVRHMMVSNVKGQFNKLTGTIVYDPANLAASKVDATVEAATVNTRETRRDDHLKSPDFLDAAKFPSLTFKSKSIYREGGELKMKGDLTIHGITREVVMAVDGPSPEIKDARPGFYRIGASATTKINRKDFGLMWNRALEAGGVVVGDEVVVTIDIEATRK